MTGQGDMPADRLLAASSLGAAGMAELRASAPESRVAAVRRRTAIRAAVDDLAVVLNQLTPLTRLHTRAILDDLDHALRGPSSRAAPDKSSLSDLNQALAGAQALTSALGLSERSLARARTLALDLAGRVDRLCTHTGARARALAHEPGPGGRRLGEVDHAFDLAHLLSGVRIRAVVLAGALLSDQTAPTIGYRAEFGEAARNLAVDLAGACVLARALPHGVAAALAVLDRARTLFGRLETDGHLDAVLADVHSLLPAIVDDATSRERLINVVCRVRDDFLIADLRHADLQGAWLDGVQWTTSTHWPAEWADRIQQDSEEIGPGIFQIRGGNARHQPVLV